MRCILIFLLISLCACQDTKKERIASLFKEWEQKEIVFPDSLVFTIQGRDTVDYPISGNKYKIVTYVDSAGCTSCKLRLPQWKGLMQSVDSLNRDSVQFLFFFFPKSGTEIYQVLLANRFKFPVCIDNSDAFNKLNHLPEDARFHTFLLNTDNRVLVVGNPVYSEQIKKMYLDVINGNQQNNQEVKDQTDFKINTNIVDFGTFDWKTERKGVFVLSNSGQHLLVIDDVTTSCGCTSVSYSKEPVAPGKSVEIEVTYKADHPEHFEKTFSVYCNAPSSPLQLKIMGNAK